MITISVATQDDLPDLVAIQNDILRTSHASFHTESATVVQRREWLAGFAETGPYRLLVAREDGAVIGYCSSSRYRDLAAFDETVEVGISISAEHRGRGVGTLLYNELFEQLAMEKVHVVLAGIALPNPASVALHVHFGFAEVGVFREYARKDGVYLSSLWLQRQISS